MPDIPAVAAIEKNSFSRPWSEKGFEDSLKLPDTIFLVAEEELSKEILGYIGMYVSFDEGEITNVAVAESAQRQGIGKALVQGMLERAKEAGVCRIVLEVRRSNAAAIHVYETSGFAAVGIRKGFYELPREDAWIMENNG